MLYITVKLCLKNKPVLDMLTSRDFFNIIRCRNHQNTFCHIKEFVSQTFEHFPGVWYRNWKSKTKLLLVRTLISKPIQTIQNQDIFNSIMKCLSECLKAWHASKSFEHSACSAHCTCHPANYAVERGWGERRGAGGERGVDEGKELRKEEYGDRGVGTGVGGCKPQVKNCCFKLL